MYEPMYRSGTKLEDVEKGTHVDRATILGEAIEAPILQTDRVLHIIWPHRW